MQDAIARWHYHQHSEELFYVMTGKLFIDLETRTEEIEPGQLFVVPRRVKHRARAQVRTTVLVIDAIDEDTHWVEARGGRKGALEHLFPP